MDGLLYHYITISKEKNISFSYKGVVNELVVSDIDLCVLIGNAIDNAVQGCLMTDGQRYINVEVIKHGLIQSIVITNSFDGVIIKDADAFMSRKRKNEVGIGIASMQAICEKNNIQMDIRYDDEKFAIMFLLPIAQKNQ